MARTRTTVRPPNPPRKKQAFVDILDELADVCEKARGRRTRESLPRRLGKDETLTTTARTSSPRRARRSTRRSKASAKPLSS